MKTIFSLLIALSTATSAYSWPNKYCEAVPGDTHKYCGAFNEESFGEIGATQKIMDSYKIGIKDRKNPITAKLVDPANQSCRNFYTRLEAKPVIDMRIFFGYKNVQDVDTGKVSTWDNQLKIAIEQYLQKPCDANNVNFFACGFAQVKQSQLSNPYQSILVKQFKNFLGQPSMLQISLISSSDWQASLNPYDSKNQNLINIDTNSGMTFALMTEKQRAHSAQVEEAWENALNEASIVFYAGNTRGYWGPDFYPPAIRSDVFAVDFDYYKNLDAKTSARVKMLSSLEKAGSKAPQLLGLFSVQSQDLFYDDLKQTAPSTSFVLNQNFSQKGAGDLHATLFGADEPVALLGSINGIAGEFCPGSFSASMGAKEIDPRSQMKFFPSIQ